MKKIPIINQAIKDRRKELKITQEDFTKIINKSIATVRRYDTGDIIPENTLILICDKLGIYFYDLLIIQKTSNEKDNYTYYSDIIEKAEKKEPQKINKDFVIVHSYIQTYLGKIYSILFDDFYFDEFYKSTNFDILISDNNKVIVKNIYIDEKNNKHEKVVDILEINEAENLITSTIKTFNENLFLIRNKRKITTIHELAHKFLEENKK